jgi:hypothetical protein
MLSKEYLDTARTLLRAAQTMTDSRVAAQLKVLAEDYERRAKKASHADAAKALARSADRDNRGKARLSKALSGNHQRGAQMHPLSLPRGIARLRWYSAEEPLYGACLRGWTVVNPHAA